MDSQIKIGFIGGGARSRALWNYLLSSEEMEDLVIPQALLDINDKIINEWRFLVENTHDTMDSFLKDDLDAVIIGTPPSTHAALSIKCLEAGIDVWSEVPMGLNMDELWGIIDARKSNKGNKGRYFYGENYCFMTQPQFMAMQNKNNNIGDIYYSEGEYSHSVEHYMIEENFLRKVDPELDPEIHTNTKPTWRADFVPIKYGHALGPCLYVLNNNYQGIIERPTEVSAMGNMKMQKRFNTQNFQIATIKTSEETIVKFVIAFVLGHHGRIFYSFSGSRGLFVGKSYQSDKHYFYSVPKDKGYYPERHQQEAQLLTNQDLIELGTPTAQGGHGGSDILMFQSWINSLLKTKPMEIDVFRGAEMTAPGILAHQAIKEKKVLEIPKFS